MSNNCGAEGDQFLTEINNNLPCSSVLLEEDDFENKSERECNNENEREHKNKKQKKRKDENEQHIQIENLSKLGGMETIEKLNGKFLGTENLTVETINHGHQSTLHHYIPCKSSLYCQHNHNITLHEDHPCCVSSLYTNHNDRMPLSSCCQEISDSTCFPDNICVQDCNFNETCINKTCKHYRFNNSSFSKEDNETSDSIKKDLSGIKNSEEISLPPDSNPYAENFINIDSVSPTESLRRKQLPTYLSLSNGFLYDEPPKYELVTGKQLKSQLEFSQSPPPPTCVRQQTQQSRKRRLSIIIFIFFIIIIGIIFFVLSKKLFTSNQSNNNSS